MNGVGKMDQPLCYKSGDKYYPCNIKIEQKEDLGRVAIFTVYNFDGPREEIEKVAVSLAKPLNVNFGFACDDAKDI